MNQRPLESYKGREFAQLVAVLTQSRDAMIDDFLVKDIVLMGRYPYKQHFGTYSSEDIKIAEHYMHEVGITHLGDEEIHHLYFYWFPSLDYVHLIHRYDTWRKLENYACYRS